MNPNPNAVPPPLPAGNSNSCLKAGLIGCGILAGIGGIGFIVMIAWLSTGPEGGVRMANQMEDYASENLEEHQVLNETEQLIAYYDNSLSLNGSDAIVLTNERLIHHRDNRDDMAMRLTDIEDFSHHEETIIGDVFQVNATDGSIMKFEIALFNQGKAFKDALERQLEKAKARIPAEDPNP